VWDAQTGQGVIDPLKGHNNCVTSAAFSPDGRHIVSGSSDWTVTVIEFSMPYTHGQNGMAEHGMRIIIEGTCCLLIDSGLPPSLWADAAVMVIYLCNFVPSARHPGIVPAEQWTGKWQDISHFRPFGCTAYAKILAEIGISKLLP